MFLNELLSCQMLLLSQFKCDFLGVEVRIAAPSLDLLFKLIQMTHISVMHRFFLILNFLPRLLLFDLSFVLLTIIGDQFLVEIYLEAARMVAGARSFKNITIQRLFIFGPLLPHVNENFILRILIFELLNKLTQILASKWTLQIDHYINSTLLFWLLTKTILRR